MFIAQSLVRSGKVSIASRRIVAGRVETTVLPIGSPFTVYMAARYGVDAPKVRRFRIASKSVARPSGAESGSAMPVRQACWRMSPGWK
jgi:hypothetical protein